MSCGYGSKQWAVVCVDPINPLYYQCTMSCGSGSKQRAVVCVDLANQLHVQGKK